MATLSTAMATAPATSSLSRLTEAQKAHNVVLVQDAFTSYFESKLVMDVVELLECLDPAMTLTYRQEYVKALGEAAVPEVRLLPEWLTEWLVERAPTLTPAGLALDDPGYRLLAHCTEKTNAPGTPKAWQRVFAAFGLELEVVASGCCRSLAGHRLFLPQPGSAALRHCAAPSAPGAAG